MKSYDVIGYAADTDIWCPGCFKEAGYTDPGEDNESNPTHPVFAGDEGAGEERCGACDGKLL